MKKTMITKEQYEIAERINAIDNPDLYTFDNWDLYTKCDYDIDLLEELAALDLVVECTSEETLDRYVRYAKAGNTIATLLISLETNISVANDGDEDPEFRIDARFRALDRLTELREMKCDATLIKEALKTEALF